MQENSSAALARERFFFFHAISIIHFTSRELGYPIPDIVRRRIQSWEINARNPIIRSGIERGDISISQDVHPRFERCRFNRSLFP